MSSKSDLQKTCKNSNKLECDAQKLKKRKIIYKTQTSKLPVPNEDF